jgi:putative heme-binding domain-containing protein
LENRGFQVGPELSAAKNRANETVLADILDPNRQITVGFRNYTVLTDDGRIFTGVLAAETATSITLRKEEGKETVILRRNIDEIEASPLSIMPEGLEKEVSPSDLADLIGYLRQVLGAPPPDSAVLFDDDPKFPSLLAEGDGTVRVSREGPHAGSVCLTVTPPQRWSLNIPGWKYPIREQPAPGEYRYLRFAWKGQGHGVMIELAVDGRWPPADKPIHRYYSGRNSTGWAAVRVSKEIPSAWSVVTRDLYADFGEFTLTGIAPTAMGGAAQFDRIELLRVVDGTTNEDE